MVCRVLSLVLLLAAAAASADPVTTGSAQRVTRPMPERLPHVVFVQQAFDGRELVLLGVTSALAIGDLYDIVDERGWSGRVRVTRVERTDEKCAGFYYQRATTRVVDRGAGESNFDQLRTVAIGPVHGYRRAARVLAHDRSGEGQARLSPDNPRPGAPDDDTTTLIDLDGDGRPEMARYLYECKDSPEKGERSGEKDTCIEEWGRERGSWRQVSRVELPCH